MPLFEYASNLQLNDGTFVDIGGDLNLHITQPAPIHPNNDPLNTLESAFSQGIGRQLLGGERSGLNHAGAMRLLPYDDALPHPSHPGHEFGAPSIFEPHGIVEHTPIPQRPNAVNGYTDMSHTQTAPRYLLTESASMSGPSDIPPSTSSALVIRHPVPSTHIVPEQPFMQSFHAGTVHAAMFPAPPMNIHDVPFLNYYPSTNLGPFGEPSRPFPGQLSWPSAFDPLPQDGPKTSINVGGNVNHIQRQGESGFHILHRAVASDAFHNAAARYPQPRCHPETRMEILEDLHQWSSRTDFGSSILWLHGPAGAGKSAIAQSFCQTLEAEHRLGAGFFFKRGHPSRGSAHKLFPTIAYQLARSRPDLKRAISEVVEDDPSIVDTDLSTQALKLIIEPCRRNSRTCNLVIVVDGLDECEGQHLQQEILCL
ncbi:hypothetical protein DFH06DRAFT_1058154, partial [Mycena polygramma]